MFRRVLHVALFFVGIAPVVWAACVFTVDARRAGVLVLLGAIGLLVNGLALSGKRLAISGAIRLIAVGISVMVAGAAMGVWSWMHTELTLIGPESENLDQTSLLFQSRDLIWIAASVGYVLFSAMLLPSAPPKPPRDPNARQRIDFRTYGR